MAEHPPPPRLIDLQTATQILNQTTDVLSTRHHLRIFLVLSFFLFSLRGSVENLTHLLTTHFDNDPFVESLLNRTQLPPNPATSQRHRRRPFLHFTRVGILDDDFLSGADDFDYRFFGNTPKPQLNHTSVILDSFDPQLGFSNFVSDNGIRVSEIVRSGVRLSFRPIKIINNTNDPKLTESQTNLQFLIGLDHELYTLLHLIAAFSVSYGFMIFTFVSIHVWVHGVIFVLVVNDFLNNHTPLRDAFRNGAILGSRRLCGVMVMRWVVRDALTQLLAAFFIGKVKDHYTLFKIFIRLKFMPFSAVSPHWVKDFDKEIYVFMFSWFLLDMFVSFVFALDAWVAMVDPRQPVKEVIDEGCRLLWLRIDPAVSLKTLEAIVCGVSARQILTNIFGKVLASMIQTFMEVYFLVAWMMHYFAVKSIDADANGEPFGNIEFEAMLQHDR